MSSITNSIFANKYQPQFLSDFYAHNNTTKFKSDEEIDNTIFDLLNTYMNNNDVNLLLVGDELSINKTSLVNAIINEYYNVLNLDTNTSISTSKNTDLLVDNNIMNRNKTYKNNIYYLNSITDNKTNAYQTNLKTFCQQFSVIKNKKKIVIIEDIDEISEAYQHIFRNFIDIYSENVMFICTCTNILQVIGALQTRLNTFNIPKVTSCMLENIVNKIIELENINLTSDAKEFIIYYSSNNINALINYLEKIKLTNKKITLELAQELCSNLNYNFFKQYNDFLYNKDLINAIYKIYEIYDLGYSTTDIFDAYLCYIKHDSSMNEDYKYKIITQIGNYLHIIHSQHEHKIQLAFFTKSII